MAGERKNKIDSSIGVQRIVYHAVDAMMIINEFVCKQYRYVVGINVRDYGTTRNRYIAFDAKSLQNIIRSLLLTKFGLEHHQLLLRDMVELAEGRRMRWR